MNLRIGSGPGSPGAIGSWAFLVVFCVPFAGIGLFALVESMRQESLGQALGLMLFGSLFLLVGLGLPFACWKAGQIRARQLREFPDQPWMWREDWRQGRVQDGSRRTLGVAWLMTLSFCGASIPLLWALPEEIIEKGNQAAWLGLVFPVAGIGMLLWAVRVTLRLQRFGTSVLELTTVPGVVGGPLRGRIQVPTGIEPSRALELRLLCVKLETSGSGQSRSSHERILWEHAVTVAPGSTHFGSLGLAVPVAFSIPFGCRPTDPDRSLQWRLEVSAEVPGVDYHAVFEVPVFETAESSPEVVEPEPEARLPETTPSGQQRIPGTKVRILPFGSGGSEFWFGPARHPGVATVLLLFAGIFGAVGLAMSGRAPLLFPLAACGSALVVALASSALWLGTTRVRVDRTGVEIRRGVLGLGRTRWIPAERVTDIEVRTGMQSGHTLYYNLFVLEKRGEGKTWERRAGSAVPDKRAAQGIAAAMRQALRP